MVIKLAGIATAALAAVVLYHLFLPVRYTKWVQVQIALGDTEYAMAEQYCPSGNPQDVVIAIQSRNHIDALVKPGEVIWVPTEASK